MKNVRLLLITCCYLLVQSQTKTALGKSYYTQKPEDSAAVYFISAAFNVKADSSTDVPDVLQQAISMVKSKYNFGIIFIPEGKYLISKTIYVLQATRLIG